MIARRLFQASGPRERGNVHRIFFIAFVAAMLNAQGTLSKQEQILIRLDKIEEQNRRILKILEEADAPTPPVKVDVSNSPALGMDKAPITIVEFTDFQCPFCSKFHTETFPELHDKYIASGKIRFVSRDLPLPMHKQAHLAALAGRCAQEQGHFWEMRNWMQSNPDRLEVGPLRSQAQDIALDMDQFDNCLVIDKYKEDIERETKEAQAMGINGTPAFIIGKSGSVIEGQVLTGAQPLAVFERAILAIK